MGRAMNRLPKLLILALLVPTVLTGCWDRIEIEERAVVLGIAIDLEPEQDKEKNQQEDLEVSHLPSDAMPPDDKFVRVTVQIAVPGRIPLGPGGGSGGGGGGGGTSGRQTVWTLEAVGHTIDDALSNLQQQISGPLFYGHLRIIVVSETYARKGVHNLNEFFRRNPEVRRTTWLVVSKGEASKLMKAAPELERVPALYLLSTLEGAVEMGKFPEDFIGLFWIDSSKLGQEGFLPYVSIKKKDNIVIDGIACFVGDKMVGTTFPLHIGHYMAIKSINPGGYPGFVKVPGETDSYVVFQATHRRSRISVSIEGGRPVFNVRIQIEGNIREKSNERIKLDQRLIRELEAELSEIGTEGCAKLIADMQNLGSDIFGFGEYVRAKKSRFWKSEVKTAEAWSAMFKEAQFEVKMNMKIRRIGMMAD